MNPVVETRALDYIARRVRTSLEEDIITLHSMAPDSTVELRSIFKEATLDASTNILDESTAQALMFHIREANLGSQYEIMAYLDSLLRDGSAIMKAAIMAEFRAKVHDKVNLVRSRFEEALEIRQTIDD